MICPDCGNDDLLRLIGRSGLGGSWWISAAPRCKKCKHVFIPKKAIIEEADNPLEIDPKTIAQMSALGQQIIAYIEQKEEIDSKIRGLREDGYELLADAGITRDVLPKKDGDNQTFADLVYGWWF